MLTEIIVGEFYNTPKWGVVFVSGHSYGKFYFYGYNYKGNRITEEEAIKTFEKVTIQDFPENLDSNPRLPYEFDLYWDIKRCDELLSDCNNDKMFALVECVKKDIFVFPDKIKKGSPLEKLKKLYEKYISLNSNEILDEIAVIVNDNSDKHICSHDKIIKIEEIITNYKKKFMLMD